VIVPDGQQAESQPTEIDGDAAAEPDSGDDAEPSEQPAVESRDREPAA
jgi:hypothetical protein